MKLNGNLTLSRLIGPAPVPEFRDCTRCGHQLPTGRKQSKCDDCTGLPSPCTRGNRDRTSLPYDPAYEVTLHYRKQPRNCPTRAALDKLGIPYTSATVHADPVAVAYAMSLHADPEAPIQYPIVMVTSNAGYLSHWEGHDPDRLGLIRLERQLYVKARVPGKQTNKTKAPKTTKELIAA